MSTLVSGCCMRAPTSQLDPRESPGSMRARYLCDRSRRAAAPAVVPRARRTKNNGPASRPVVAPDEYVFLVRATAAVVIRGFARARSTGDMPHVLHVVAVFVAGLLIAGE